MSLRMRCTTCGKLRKVDKMGMCHECVFGKKYKEKP